MKVTHSLCRLPLSICHCHPCMYIAGSVYSCMLGFWYGGVTYYNELDSARLYSTDMHVSSPFANCIFYKYIILYFIRIITSYSYN